MQINVYISATLRGFVNRRSSIVVEGGTVAEVIEVLQDEYPELKNALFDELGKLRGYVSIFLNEKNVTDTRGWDTPVSDKDEIFLLPAIAGGAPGQELISAERRKEAVLDDEEVERFSKHLLLREIGVKGQKKLKAARVIIFGAGSLGAPVIQYLAAAGVGTIAVADPGEVELSHLQNQVIHGKRDLKRPKVASARDTIKAINPKIKIETYLENITAENVLEVIEPYDVIVDCSDNHRMRYLLNDACVLSKKPYVFGAMHHFEGRVTSFDTRTGPCYRCVFPSPPPQGLVPTCAEGGVISPLPGIIGSTQANEVLKLLIGIGEPLIGKLQIIDTWNNLNRIVQIEKNDACPICGSNPSILAIEEFDYDDFCGLKQKEDEIEVTGIDIEELTERMDAGEALTIVDVREPHERAIHRFPNAIAIPIGQLARRQNELNPEIDTIFICREGKRSILAINTLREAGYQGPMYNLKGGIESAKGIIFSHEGAWL